MFHKIKFVSLRILSFAVLERRIALNRHSEDAKTLADKEAALADNQASLEKNTEAKSSATKELGALFRVSCDFKT